ncbi:MAG: hypothetical protein ACTSUE_06390 [Promethearchaeota archaeon]
MNTQEDINLNENLKEATELLNCIDIPESKLENIVSHIAEKIRKNPKIMSLVENITSIDSAGDSVESIDDLYSILQDERFQPHLLELLQELGNEPAIIENIEKEILPILFRDS